jgi:hypothetical protein
MPALKQHYASVPAVQPGDLFSDEQLMTKVEIKQMLTEGGFLI